MSPEQKELLGLHRLPLMLSVPQVAYLTGFAAHDIPVFVKHKLLQPLGKPGRSSPKYFFAEDIMKLDAKWFARAQIVRKGRWDAKRNGGNN